MKLLLNGLCYLSLLVSITGQETAAVADVVGTGKLEDNNAKTLTLESTAVEDVNERSFTLPPVIEATVCVCCYVCGSLTDSIFAEYCPCMYLTTDKCDTCPTETAAVQDVSDEVPPIVKQDISRIGAGDETSVETAAVRDVSDEMTPIVKQNINVCVCCAVCSNIPNSVFANFCECDSLTPDKCVGCRNGRQCDDDNGGGGGGGNSSDGNGGGGEVDDDKVKVMMQ